MGGSHRQFARRWSGRVAGTANLVDKVVALLIRGQFADSLLAELLTLDAPDRKPNDVVLVLAIDADKDLVGLSNVGCDLVPAEGVQSASVVVGVGRGREGLEGVEDDELRLRGLEGRGEESLRGAEVGEPVEWVASAVGW